MRRHGFRDRIRVDLAVDGAARRREDHFPEPATASGLDQVDEAEHVDVGIECRLRHRARHAHLRGVVHESVRAEAFDDGRGPRRVGCRSLRSGRLAARSRVSRSKDRRRRARRDRPPGKPRPRASR